MRSLMSGRKQTQVLVGVSSSPAPPSDAEHLLTGINSNCRSPHLDTGLTFDGRFCQQEAMPNPPHVRFWLKADIPAYVVLCPLSGVKRTL